jgi:hypothetical protein
MALIDDFQKLVCFQQFNEGSDSLQIDRRAQLARTKQQFESNGDNQVDVVGQVQGHARPVERIAMTLPCLTER